MTKRCVKDYNSLGQRIVQHLEKIMTSCTTGELLVALYPDEDKRNNARRCHLSKILKKLNNEGILNGKQLDVEIETFNIRSVDRSIPRTIKTWYWTLVAFKPKVTIV